MQMAGMTRPLLVYEVCGEPYSAASLRGIAFSTLAAQNLNSGILPNGSSFGLVRILAAAST
jgi:hypothetical protein